MRLVLSRGLVVGLCGFGVGFVDASVASDEVDAVFDLVADLGVFEDDVEGLFELYIFEVEIEDEAYAGVEDEIVASLLEEVVEDFSDVVAFAADGNFAFAGAHGGFLLGGGAFEGGCLRVGAGGVGDGRGEEEGGEDFREGAVGCLHKI